MGIEENQELNAREAWDREYQKASLRDSNFETMSGVPVDPVYGEDLFPGPVSYTHLTLPTKA